MTNLKKFSNNLTSEQLDKRDRLIFGKPYDEARYSMGGICRFEIPLTVVKELLIEGLADPDDCQNLAPSIVEIYNWCNEHTLEDWYAHGYAVSGKRGDCRVSVEGIGSYKPLKRGVVGEYKKMFYAADDLMGNTKTPAYCWYD